MAEITHYLNSEGQSIVSLWLAGLTDTKAKVAIVRRLNRAQADNLGECKSLGGGLFEMKIDIGPGYRVYFARIGNELLLLLCGGDKRTQDADIRRARTYLDDYYSRACRKGKVG